MTHTVLDSEFLNVIDETSVPDPIGSGFEFVEGPIWNPKEQFLFFSDIPGNVRRGWDLKGGVVEIQRPTHKSNGMTYDQDLNLLVCEHETSRVVRLSPDGTQSIVADTFEGKQLNSPNDIIVHSDGSIWFTDPTYGRMDGFGIERKSELGFQGVYRVPPDGGPPELMVHRTTFDQPNGLTFSPCEKYLFVNDTVQANIRRFDVGENGDLTNERIFASAINDATLEGVPDGLKCDSNGNIWCTGPGGIWIYAFDGLLLGKISIPEVCANFHWGGSDWRTLFCTASTSVYALPVKVGPRIEPFMQEISTPKQNTYDLRNAALLIQDMQVDAVGEDGKANETGAPEHCKAQNCVANIQALASACRDKGIPVIHIHFIVDPETPGMSNNAPLFEFVLDTGANRRGTPGAAAVSGLEPKNGDYFIEKNRMSPWETTSLDTILRSHGISTLINTGAWTNMAVEHTARTGADRGYKIVIPEDATSTMNEDWQRASIDFAVQNVAQVESTADLLKKIEEIS
jgi:gluconolactonase